MLIFIWLFSGNFSASKCVCVHETIPTIFPNTKFSIKYIKNYVPLRPFIRSYNLFHTIHTHIVDMDEYIFDVCALVHMHNIMNETPFGLFTTPHPHRHTKVRLTYIKYDTYICNNIKASYRTTSQPKLMMIMQYGHKYI